LNRLAGVPVTVTGPMRPPANAPCGWVPHDKVHAGVIVVERVEVPRLNLLPVSVVVDQTCADQVPVNALQVPKVCTVIVTVTDSPDPAAGLISVTFIPPVTTEAVPRDELTAVIVYPVPAGKTGSERLNELNDAVPVFVKRPFTVAGDFPGESTLMPSVYVVLAKAALDDSANAASTNTTR
jgi:hypothetical protein